MTEKQARKIVNAIFANKVALHYNEELSKAGIFKHATKNKLSGVIKELMKYERDFDAIQGQKEDATDDVFDSFFAMIDKMTEIPFQEANNITLILEAYQKSPSSIEGITRKILNK